MRRSSSRAFAALLVARAVMEAIAFACLFALVQMIGGREPLALTPITLGFIGATLVLVAALRETGSEARGTTVVGVTLGACALLAVLLPTHPLDLVTWGGRIIAFVIAGEVYLWRVVSLARGGVRWSDARNAVPFAAVALTVVAIAPIPVDRTPLVPLALLLVAASAVALSVARSAEELSLTTGPRVRRGSRRELRVFALGVGAARSSRPSPRRSSIRLSPIWAQRSHRVRQLLFYLLLPSATRGLGVRDLQPFFGGGSPSGHRQLGRIPLGRGVLREIERTRPLVVGGIETSSRSCHPGGARASRTRRPRAPARSLKARSWSEAPASGLSRARCFVRFPAPRGAPGAPRDDGTAATALRIIYWRLLALAERAGQGWRAAAETPSEHQRRLSGADPRWTAAAPIVAAFENLRYGEIQPDGDTVTRAREALRAVEAAVRT